MLHDTKPPLDEALLMHFGVKGMKWGVRHRRPDEAERRARFSPKAKKVALATAGIAGALAVAYLLNRHGNTKISAGGLTDRNSPLYSKMTAGKKAASYTMNNKRTMSTPVKALPPARRMLTSPAISRATRAASSSRDLNLGDLNAVRDAMNDPNFVWEF